MEHHVKEEEKELFFKVRKSLLDLDELGGIPEVAKQNLKKELIH